MKYLFAAFLMIYSSSAIAVDYTHCADQRASTSCTIAYQKIKTLKNPKTKKDYLTHPSLEVHVAKVQLDQDNYNEIIVALSDQSKKTRTKLCNKGNMCPNYILQNRNIPGEDPTLNNIRAFGPIYTTGIGLSTDEIINRYRSLRVYKDAKRTKFDVYQYDRKSDNYFNISTQ